MTTPTIKTKIFEAIPVEAHALAEGAVIVVINLVIPDPDAKGFICTQFRTWLEELPQDMVDTILTDVFKDSYHRSLLAASHPTGEPS